MAKGQIDVIPEFYANIAAWLPRGVSVTGVEDYGGAKRLQIEGSQIAEGVQYQLVIIDHELCRVIELRDGSHQPFEVPASPAMVRQLRAEVAKMDHDRDGRVGGSVKGRKAKAAKVLNVFPAIEIHDPTKTPKKKPRA